MPSEADYAAADAHAAPSAAAPPPRDVAERCAELPSAADASRADAEPPASHYDADATLMPPHITPPPRRMS